MNAGVIEIKRLLRDYQNWLKSRTTLRDVKGEYVEIDLVPSRTTRKLSRHWLTTHSGLTCYPGVPRSYQSSGLRITQPFLSSTGRERMCRVSKPKEISNKTVLVVDDEPAIRELIATILGRANYSTLVAESGDEALAQSKAHKGTIDLLLSNVQMPGISGVELGSRLSIERPEMRVMLMSGFTSGLLVLNEGWHFLHKPFVPNQLLNLIESCLARVEPNEVPNLDEHRK